MKYTRIIATFFLSSFFSLNVWAQCTVPDLTNPPIGLFAVETINYSGNGTSELEGALSTWQTAISGRGLASPISILRGTNSSGASRVEEVSGALTCGSNNALGCTTHESSIDHNNFKWRGNTLIEIVSDPDEMWPSDVRTIFSLDAEFNESATPGDGIVQVSRESIFTHEIGHYVGADHSADHCSTQASTIPTMDASPLYSATIDVNNPANSTYTWLGLRGGGVMEPHIAAAQTLATADNTWVATHYTGFDPCLAPAAACGTGQKDELCLLGECEAPPASVEFFRVFQTSSGFVAKWSPVYFNSRGLYLQGRNSENDSWKNISGSPQNLIPYGNAEYSINVPHHNYYQVVEVDKNGKESIVGQTRPMSTDFTQVSDLPELLRGKSKEEKVETLTGPEFLGNPSLKAKNELIRQRVESGVLTAATQTHTGSNSALSGGDGYVIYTNTELLPYVQAHVADYWGFYWGVTPVEIVNIDTAFGVSADAVDPEPFMVALRSDIQSRSSSGQFGFFHFVGSASDWREIGPRHEEYWVGPEWIAAHNSLMGTTNPLRDPLAWKWRDVIPVATYVDNAGGPDENMAYWRPYYFSDLFYADTTNQDRVPDVVLSRWPVASPDELLQLAYKMQIYNSGWSDISLPAVGKSSYQYGVATLLDDQDFNPVGHGATGAMATALMNDAKSLFPANVYNEVDVKTSSCEHPCYDDVLESWTSHSSAILGLGAGSNSSLVVNLMDSGLFYTLPEWTTPLLVMGASCGAGNFLSTPRIVYLESFPTRISNKMMLNPEKGAIAYVGPTEATWQVGNGKIAKGFSQEMFDETQSIAQNWTEAWQWALATGTERERQTAESYVFLGDPLTRMIPPAIPTNAPRAATTAGNYVVPVENSPNPFNPRTMLRFTLPRTGKVTLRVFNIRGELVRTLLENDVRSAGLHELNWNALDDKGVKISSGVYFAKLYVDGKPRGQRKLAVVK